MKKVILFAAVAATIALASCKGGGEATTNDSTMVGDTNVVVVDTAIVVAVDTAAVVDTAVVAE